MTGYVQPAEATRREARLTSGPGITVSEGSLTVVRQYYGSHGSDLPEPQAFLVEVFPTDGELGAHFHPVDQFQVLYGSSGAWYQRARIEAGSVRLHYADAHTTYGPFGSGDAPLAFFTLRAQSTSVTAPMPGSRHLLEGGPQRNLHVDIPLDATSPPASGAVRLSTPIDPQPDGLAVVLLELGASAIAAVPDVTAASAGQYVVVLRGSVSHAGRLTAERSLAWCGAGSVVGQVEASAQGAVIACLQFPDAHGADL
jgi:hypothetical protein